MQSFGQTIMLDKSSWPWYLVQGKLDIFFHNLGLPLSGIDRFWGGGSLVNSAQFTASQFTARRDSRFCRQLCSTTFKLTCGWAPPLPGCHSRDEFSKTLPVFRLSSASLCYHQHKLENEKWDRPGNEANCRLFLTTEEVTCCHTLH